MRCPGPINIRVLSDCHQPPAAECCPLPDFESGPRRRPNSSRIRLCAALLLTLAVPLLSNPLTVQASEGEAAETQTGKRVLRLTLEEIIRMGLEASPKLWAQRYVIDQAAADLGEAQAGRYPRMEYLQISGVVPEAKGNVFYSPDARSDLLNHLGPFTRLELTVNQPLYTFGRLKKYIEAARHGMEAKQASLRRFELELVVSLKELYYTILLNDELHRLVSDTVSQFSKAVEKAEEEIAQNTGTLTQQDLLKLKYGLSRASGQRLEIEKGIRLVHSALGRLLFLPEEEDYVLAETDLKPVKFKNQDLRTYQDRAKQNRPEWKELEAGIASREAELKAEQLKYLPDFFVTGLLRYAVAGNRDEQENPFAVEDFNYFNGGIFLGLRLALDMGLPERIAGKRAQLFGLHQQRKDAVSGMLLEVQKAYEEAVGKGKELEFAQQARKDGRALAAMGTANFYLGLGEAKDLFEAVGMYTEAAARYYQAVKDFNVAVAELARVTGVDFLDRQP